MEGEWKKVETIELPHIARGQYRVSSDGTNLIIEKRVVKEWEDVTKDCHLEFRDSHHCDGRYIAILHRQVHHTEKLAGVVGTQGLVAQSNYKIEKAMGAFTSFNVFKKV